MSARPWNHNIHYHDLVLRSIPPGSRRALDVGCGTGLLAHRLAEHCDEVVAIDADHGVISDARTASAANAGITFIAGDVMTHPFLNDSFDFITAVAALHHLPLRLALTRFQNLLRADGVLFVVGSGTYARGLRMGCCRISYELDLALRTPLCRRASASARTERNVS